MRKTKLHLYFSDMVSLVYRIVEKYSYYHKKNLKSHTHIRVIDRRKGTLSSNDEFFPLNINSFQ